jgi:hypothetical protein
MHSMAFTVHRQTPVLYLVKMTVSPTACSRATGFSHPRHHRPDSGTERRLIEAMALGTTGHAPFGHDGKLTCPGLLVHGIGFSSMRASVESSNRSKSRPGPTEHPVMDAFCNKTAKWTTPLAAGSGTDL